MEIKLTADKKLLEALDKLAETFKPLAAALVAAERSFDAQLDNIGKYAEKKAQEPKLDPMTALPVVEEEEPAPQAETKDDPAPPWETVPKREDVQRVAVTKIQGGLGKKVKALIEKHEGTRVGDVPEKNLAAFLAELEALA